MKISKSILTAMAAGLLATGMTSCETDIIEVTDTKNEKVTLKCQLGDKLSHDETGGDASGNEHTGSGNNGDEVYWNCPGCGLG